jgi:hypothetical protein
MRLHGRVAESGLKHSPAKGEAERSAGSNPVPSAWFNHGGVNDSQGIPAEQSFKEFAEARGWGVSPATKYQNIREHWDYALTKGTESIRVDVKGRKRPGRRRDQAFSDDLVWVEFKNSWGNPGWLYGSAAIVSFEFSGYFILCHREALARFSERVVDLDNPPVKDPTHALYKGYTRMDRSDLLALIRTTDLLQPEILYEVWFK